MINIDWISFLSGAASVTLTYALFKTRSVDEMELLDDVDDDDEYIINDSRGRTTKLYCQSCRKQKRHVEIERDLWQCTRCKRHTDLRVS